MKKSTEVTNLPIISISEGNQIGTVKSLIINPDKNSIDFLTIEQEDWQVSVKAIPFKKVIGVGEYAVTVEHEGATIDLNEIPIANQLLNKKITLIEARVMTRKGEMLGQVLEYFLNEDTGDLMGLFVKLPNREVVISIDHVITLGKDLIIVNEHAKDAFLQKAEQLTQNDGDGTYSDDEIVQEEPIPQSQPVIDEPVQREEEPKENPSEKRENLRKKQIELLVGKTATTNIYGNSGDLLIRSGTVLTEEDIKQAQEEGQSVFVELSMNVSE